jgi:hypothetical protein
MEVGPPGSPMQVEIPNHRERLRLRAVVVSVAVKGPLSAGQVCDEKTNVSEPLRTHRKPKRWHRNRGSAEPPGQRRARSGVLSAGGLPVCCPGGARCRGGVSLSQAPAWNRRTCRFDSDGQSKWVLLAPWSREGERQGQDTPRRRVPTRSTGADRLVVAVKAL